MTIVRNLVIVLNKFNYHHYHYETLRINCRMSKNDNQRVSPSNVAPEVTRCLCRVNIFLYKICPPLANDWL